MVPREHGAYGQLVFPLLTPVAIGRPSLAAAALIAAVVCAFLAHEPLVVLLGRRGSRAAREHGDEARRWLLATTGAAALGLALAAAAMTSDARRALTTPAVLAVAAGAVVVSGREHTVGGEILSGLALASTALPVGAAAGLDPLRARTCAAAFGAGFTAATACVHAVIACTRHPPALAARAAAVVSTAALVVVVRQLSQTDAIAAAGPWAALPLCAGGVLLAAMPPSARHLRRVGWTLVGATVACGLILVFGLR